jgi:CrcB protein
MKPSKAFRAELFPRRYGREHFYQPKDTGFEREIAKRLEYWSKLRAEAGSRVDGHSVGRRGVGGGLRRAGALLLSPVGAAAGVAFNWGIFVVNYHRRLLMGYDRGSRRAELNLSPELRSFLPSAFWAATPLFDFFAGQVLLLQRGDMVRRLFYVIGSVVLSILALYAGLWIMRSMYA